MYSSCHIDSLNVRLILKQRFVQTLMRIRRKYIISIFFLLVYIRPKIFLFEYFYVRTLDKILIQFCSVVDLTWIPVTHRDFM